MIDKRGGLKIVSISRRHKFMNPYSGSKNQIIFTTAY